MARYYDRNRQQAVDYNIGDKVWLEGKDIYTNRPSKKLDDKRYGPFKVTEIIGPNAYKLDLPPSMMIYPIFNTVKLSRTCQSSSLIAYIVPTSMSS